MAKAKTYNFHESLYTMKELAELFKLSYCRMSNLMHKFNHDADTIYLQRNSKGAKRSGKNPRLFAVDLHGNTRMSVADIAKTTGFSTAAISGKIKRGVIGSDLLKSKKIKPLYAVELKPKGSTVKKLPNTVRADKNKLKVIATQERDVSELTSAELRNAVDDYLAAGGKIQKLQADGNINGQSWKDQSKKTWKNRTTLASKKKRQVVVNEQGEIKGGKVDVDVFIAQLESERDQRKAYGEVLHLAASDEDLSNLEASLPETAFGDSLEKK